MMFDVGVPSGAIKHFSSWVGTGDLHEFASSAEVAGFDSVHVTDHPFPQDAWLASGGHQAFDPFVALASMAAVTSTIQLRTNLLVAGYRHPYVMARSIASLDRLSRGRMIVGIGAGYLEPEFAVLAADFAGRGRRFDEAIRAMSAAWTGATVDHDGQFYPAHGHTMEPTPLQTPRPRLWIGGNSTAAKRRAAEMAEGWIPMGTTPTLARITGTTELDSLDQLADEIIDVHKRRAAAGREGRFDVACSPFGFLTAADDPDGSRNRELIDAHRRIGVTALSLPCRSRSLNQCKDEMAWLGDTIIDPLKREWS